MVEQIKGYSQLQARLHAVGGTKMSTGMMKQLGARAIAEQKLLVMPHKKTGVTQASIHVSNITATSVTTAVGGAGRWLEFGTRPHVITPKVAKVLAWASGPAGGANRRLTGATRVGKLADHFARIVHHPGTRPYPFMIPGAKLAISKSGLADVVVKAWNDAA